MGNPRTPRRHAQPIIAEPLELRRLLAIDAYAGHNSDIEPLPALFAQAGPIPSLTPEGLIETSASLSASRSAADHGTEIGFTIDVIGSEPFDPLPSGTVSIYAGTELLTTVPVGNGFATWDTSTLPVGIHEIHA